ncbi:MAG: dockerin type I domain-containing protein [Ruminococcus flavefaciens]|nr:dockerin type I domain-containing protein [Ruminococcus flavefaciens]
MKTKKLTALLASAILAVCAVPANAFAEPMRILEDGTVEYTLVDGTVIHSGEECTAYLEAYINSDSDLGDVNHDGVITSDDAKMILEYSVTCRADHYDYYTEEEHENFKKYGDVFNDGIINSTDAAYVLSKAEGKEVIMGDMNQDGVIDATDSGILWDISARFESLSEEEQQYYVTYGDFNGNNRIDVRDIVLLGEINKDTTDDIQLGDVNHDGFVDCVDASLVLVYYADLSTDGYDNYTAEEHENFQKYGNMVDDEDHKGFVDAADACIILCIYAENSTLPVFQED